MLRNVTAALCLDVIEDSRSGYSSLIHLVDTNALDSYPGEVPWFYLFTKWLVSTEHTIKQTTVHILDTARNGEEIYNHKYDKEILLKPFVHSSITPFEGIRIPHPGLYMIQLTLKDDKGEEFSSSPAPLIMLQLPTGEEAPKQNAPATTKKASKKKSK